MATKFTIMARRLRKTTESFINEATQKHGDKYNYSLVNYEGCYTPVKIVCPIHGIFKQKPYLHLHGNGCAKCGMVSSNKKSTTVEFIDRATKVHGLLYNYSLVNYSSAKEPVAIVCPVHGVFQQVPNYHLSGNGCTQCYKDNNGFGRKEFMSSCKNGIGTLYIIRCIRDTEVFYKVGITSKSIQERFKRFKRFPYQYTIVFELKRESDFIFDLEKRILRFYKNNRYTPSLNFKGNTECFIIDDKTIQDDIRRNESFTRSRAEKTV